MLVCTRGDDAGKNFPLKAGVNRIGVTDDCDVVINDNTLTANHNFEVVYDERRDNFSLRPGRMASKLFLNNEYVDSSIFMQAHDTIKTGKSEFMLVVF